MSNSNVVSAIVPSQKCFYLNDNNVKTRKNGHFTGIFDNSIKRQKSIGFVEGMGLLANGFKQQVKGIITSVFDNPVKTLKVIGSTTAILMLLPLIGIPTAVGGAAMALGFAAFATGKTVKHVAQFIKNNSNGEYDMARKNLKQIGGDGLDLVLSAPFVPKAFGQIKDFSKYGQIAFNTQALSELKAAKGIKDVWKALKGADKNAHRAINYNKVTEKEIAKLTGVTEAEKANIQKYISDYNVPIDKIPETVVDLWAKEHGISAKPSVRGVTLNKTTLGYASQTECEIGINDGKSPAVKINSNCHAERFQQVGVPRLNKNNYEFTFKDLKTGEVFFDYADKGIIESRQNLVNSYKNLTPEANKILTMTHEREHIDQFAKMIASGQKFNLTPKAKEIYSSMIKQMKPLTPEEIKTYQQMANYKPARRTLVAYIMEPSEIAARAKEIELLGTQKFQTINKVFEEVNKIAINPKNTKTFLINGVRSQSAAV